MRREDVTDGELRHLQTLRDDAACNRAIGKVDELIAELYKIDNPDRRKDMADAARGIIKRCLPSH